VLHTIHESVIKAFVVDCGSIILCDCDGNWKKKNSFNGCLLAEAELKQLEGRRRTSPSRAARHGTMFFAGFHMRNTFNLTNCSWPAVRLSQRVPRVWFLCLYRGIFSKGDNRNSHRGGKHCYFDFYSWEMHYIRNEPHSLLNPILSCSASNRSAKPHDIYNYVSTPISQQKLCNPH